MQVNKEEIWKSVHQNHELIKESLKTASESLETEFRGTRERLIEASLKINSLFLTGWVALLSVGKLKHSFPTVMYSLLIIGCGLHVLVFALILLSQWKTMLLNFNSQTRLSGLQKKLNETTLTKRNHILSFDGADNISSLLQNFDDLDKTLAQSNGDYSTKYHEENSGAWLVGRWAIIVFFFSMIFSLVSFGILLTP